MTKCPHCGSEPIGAGREVLIRRIELARSFIAKEYNDPAQELRGDWIDPRAKPAHDALCLCLEAIAGPSEPIGAGVREALERIVKEWDKCNAEELQLDEGVEQAIENGRAALALPQSPAPGEDKK